MHFFIKYFSKYTVQKCQLNKIKRTKCSRLYTPRGSQTRIIYPDKSKSAVTWSLEDNKKSINQSIVKCEMCESEKYANNSSTRPSGLAFSFLLRNTDHFIVPNCKKLARFCFSFRFQFNKKLFVSHPFFDSSIWANIIDSTIPSFSRNNRAFLKIC